MTLEEMESVFMAFSLSIYRYQGAVRRVVAARQGVKNNSAGTAIERYEAMLVLFRANDHLAASSRQVNKLYAAAEKSVSESMKMDNHQINPSRN